MKIKKLFALGLATVMAMSAFTGCGKDKDKKTVEVIEIDLTSEEYAFGVDKNQPELLEEVNDFIAQIKEDGTFDEIVTTDSIPLPEKMKHEKVTVLSLAPMIASVIDHIENHEPVSLVYDVYNND